MKKLLSLLLIICSIGVAYADDKSTVTSLKYVTDELNTRQDKFGANDGKAMTFTNVAGGNTPRDVKESLGTSTSDNGLPTVSAVNTGLDDKQNTIPAANTNTVVTYTGTPGTLGQKGIYQDTGTYASQQDNLIDAGTFNAALRNGLENEFVCADRDPVSNQCWLWSIDNETENRTKNLLDPSFMDNSTYGPVTVNGVTTERARILPTENGKTYTLSATLVSTGRYYYYLREIYPDGTTGSAGQFMWNNNDASNPSGTQYRTYTFTSRDNATYVVYFANLNSVNNLTLTDYQMEEGTVATPYVPYGNIYIPQNQSAQNQ